MTKMSHLHLFLEILGTEYYYILFQIFLSKVGITSELPRINIGCLSTPAAPGLVYVTITSLNKMFGINLLNRTLCTSDQIL